MIARIKVAAGRSFPKSGHREIQRAAFWPPFAWLEKENLWHAYTAGLIAPRVLGHALPKGELGVRRACGKRGFALGGATGRRRGYADASTKCEEYAQYQPYLGLHGELLLNDLQGASTPSIWSDEN